MTAERQYLCTLDDLPETGSKGFVLTEDGKVAVFIVRQQGRLHAYKNQCPHTGAPLEWKPDQFLDFENRFIQCALHGALFEINTGYCVRGPCAGNSLQSEEIVVEGRAVYLVKNEVSKADTAPVR